MFFILFKKCLFDSVCQTIAKQFSCQIYNFIYFLLLEATKIRISSQNISFYVELFHFFYFIFIINYLTTL